MLNLDEIYKHFEGKIARSKVEIIEARKRKNEKLAVGKRMSLHCSFMVFLRERGYMVIASDEYEKLAKGKQKKIHKQYYLYAVESGIEVGDDDED